MDIAQDMVEGMVWALLVATGHKIIEEGQISMTRTKEANTDPIHEARVASLEVRAAAIPTTHHGARQMPITTLITTPTIMRQEIMTMARITRVENPMTSGTTHVGTIPGMILPMRGERQAVRTTGTHHNFRSREIIPEITMDGISINLRAWEELKD